MQLDGAEDPRAADTGSGGGSACASEAELIRSGLRGALEGPGSNNPTASSAPISAAFETLSSRKFTPA